MNNHENILGPLNFNQLIVAIIGFGASYSIYASKFFNEYTLPLTLGVALITLAIIIKIEPKKIGIQDFEHYIETQKVTLTPPQFDTYITQKIAEVSSQIAIRKEKGLRSDGELEKALQILEKYKK